MSELAHPDVSDKIHQSCRDFGYFFIKDIEKTAINLPGVFTEANDFFRLPANEKSIYPALHANQYLGYRGIGTEKSVMTGYPELCEQYKFGYFHDKKLNASTLDFTYLSSYASIFKAHVKTYFHSMEEIANKVLTTIANNFGLGQDYFLPYCQHPTHQMGLNYYPVGRVNDENSQQYAMSAHKDLCLLTIIAQKKSGLMAQDRYGNWRLIPSIPNTLVVMLGDYLERWTNHYYLAPLHRVLESSDEARISIIYKHRPNYETVIPVIPGINHEKEHDTASIGFHTGKAYEEKINRIMSHSE